MGDVVNHGWVVVGGGIDGGMGRGRQDSRGSHTITPKHACACQRYLPFRDFVVPVPLLPVCQPGLATTPKLTGGHGVARGPDRVDGFALCPAWTNQSMFWRVITGDAVAAAGRPIVSRNACCP
jgi:hypothetical protein